MMNDDDDLIWRQIVSNDLSKTLTLARAAADVRVRSR